MAWVEFQALGVRNMFASVFGMSVIGLQAHLIRVEVDVSNGLPSFEIVGPYPIRYRFLASAAFNDDLVNSFKKCMIDYEC
ncbi:hypothetical protein JCM15765_32030 [Paradesulfitobacterium aromaticivorans]